MKMLLIGQSVEDHINMEGEEKPVTPGGVYYSAAGLNALKENDDEIFLCTSISEQNYYLFSDVYDLISLKHSYKVETIPTVYLTLNKDLERGECYNCIADSLVLREEYFNEYGGIYINMITGFDITKDTLHKIRSMFAGIIYFDVHSLARGLNENMRRPFRQIPDFDIWARNVDIIQVNENELLTLSSSTDEVEIASKVLSYGVKILIITYGSLGAALYFLKDNKPTKLFVPVTKKETNNQVGCGDVFGAAFFYSYIKKHNEDAALRFAVKASQAVASYLDIRQIRNLKNDV